VFSLLNYGAVLSDKGKFKTNPAGTLYHGQPYGIKITGDFYETGTVLKDGNTPGPGLYKVLTDEEFNGLPSYWERDAGRKEFRSAVIQANPETVAAVSGTCAAIQLKCDCPLAKNRLYEPMN
jgi:hypothetical protein